MNWTSLIKTLPTITIEDGSNHDKEQLVVSNKQNAMKS